MAAMKKHYTEAFKRQTVIESYRCDNLPQFREDLGISNSMMYRWRNQYPDLRPKAFVESSVVRTAAEASRGVSSGSLGRTLEEQLAQLRQKLAVVEQERDILKKAIGIFSNPPR